MQSGCCNGILNKNSASSTILFVPSYEIGGVIRTANRGGHDPLGASDHSPYYTGGKLSLL
jgi:hypothetical protein